MGRSTGGRMAVGGICCRASPPLRSPPLASSACKLRPATQVPPHIAPRPPPPRRCAALRSRCHWRVARALSQGQRGPAPRGQPLTLTSHTKPFAQSASALHTALVSRLLFRPRPSMKGRASAEGTSRATTSASASSCVFFIALIFVADFLVGSDDGKRLRSPGCHSAALFRTDGSLSKYVLEVLGRCSVA